MLNARDAAQRRTMAQAARVCVGPLARRQQNEGRVVRHGAQGLAERADGLPGGQTAGRREPTPPLGAESQHVTHKQSGAEKRPSTRRGRQQARGREWDCLLAVGGGGKPHSA